MKSRISYKKGDTYWSLKGTASIVVPGLIFGAVVVVSVVAVKKPDVAYKLASIAATAAKTAISA